MKDYAQICCVFEIEGSEWRLLFITNKYKKIILTEETKKFFQSVTISMDFLCQKGCDIHGTFEGINYKCRKSLGDNFKSLHIFKATKRIIIYIDV